MYAYLHPRSEASTAGINKSFQLRWPKMEQKRGKCEKQEMLRFQLRHGFGRCLQNSSCFFMSCFVYVNISTPEVHRAQQRYIPAPPLLLELIGWKHTFIDSWPKVNNEWCISLVFFYVRQNYLFSVCLFHSSLWSLWSTLGYDKLCMALHGCSTVITMSAVHVL